MARSCHRSHVRSGRHVHDHRHILTLNRVTQSFGNGNPLLIVKVLMGHERIETTDRYLRAIAADGDLLYRFGDGYAFGEFAFDTRPSDPTVTFRLFRDDGQTINMY